MTMPAQQKGGVILVVDDTPYNLELLANVLERQAYTVVPASSGEKALELVHTVNPELILLDINMPQMNGYEVCRHLKADEETSDIPVIFISALGDIEDIVKGFEAGGVDYIIKPFRIPEVMVRVDSHITLSRQRKQLEALRERDRQHYETLDHIRQQFIGSATHDLKSPLALITGYTFLLETHEPLEDDEVAQEYIDSLKRGTDRMSALINDMLDLLQMDTRRELDLEPVAIAPLMEEAIIDFRLRAEEKHLTISVALPDDDAMVMADTTQFPRVIDNLISNAIKYTPEGGNIHIAGYTDNHRHIIEVQDTGLGIPEKDLPHLFEPFYRVKKRDRKMEVEGTGLGLSIVKSIIDKHHGEITVESIENEGSIFRVFLPLYSPQKHETA